MLRCRTDHETIMPPFESIIAKRRSPVIQNGRGMGQDISPTNWTEMSTVKSLPAEYYTKFLSNDAKARQPSPSTPFILQLFAEVLILCISHSVRSLLPLEDTPGLISLLAGKPNSDTFPITSLSFNVRSPEDWSSEQTLTIDGRLLANALQYGRTPGIPELLQWIWGLQEFSHGRKEGEGWASLLSTVNQTVTDIFTEEQCRLRISRRNLQGSYCNAESWRSGLSRITCLCVSAFFLVRVFT